MLPLSEISLSVIAWTIGGLSSLSLGIRSILSYQQTHNLLSRYFAWAAILLAIGEFLYQIPAWFTLNPDVLRLWALAGDVFIYACMLALARLLWFVAGRRSNHFIIVAVLIVIWAGVALVLDASSSSVVVNSGEINWVDDPVSAVMRGILYAAVMLPSGLFLLKNIKGQMNLQSRLRTYAIGAALLGGGVVLSMTYLVSQGREASSTSVLYLILFIGLLVGIWAPLILNRTMKLK